MKIPPWFKGEFAGTFVLVFFGCGAVATAVVLDSLVGLFQVAIVWGLGLALAIHLVAATSGAHLNPAITLAFAVFSHFPPSRIPGYLAAQFLGAFLAAAVVFLLFGGAIEAYEVTHGIQRGSPGSETTAMIFGEYFPNPAVQALSEQPRDVANHLRACFAEFLGTALLALAIFSFIHRAPSDQPPILIPLGIGLTLTALIVVFAPLTMAGFNPARDLAPRVLSVLAGWRSIPFTTNGLGWLTVYVVSPCAGALAGGALFRWLVAERRDQERLAVRAE